jgi:hypothetical protein
MKNKLFWSFVHSMTTECQWSKNVIQWCT